MFPTRRTFLQSTAAAIATLFLPKLPDGKRTSFWFIHGDTGESWHVADPVHWSLDNARQPILERASKRLLTLTPADGDRIIRLVVRRCKLNLIELRPANVVVHHWGAQGFADLRPFLKTHGLARKEIKVVVRERKREITTRKTGDEFLYGQRLPFPLSLWFPFDLYTKKWRRRNVEEPDDWQIAPGSDSNFCWEGVEQRWIPWRVLKSAWRHEIAPLCQNCDKPTLLISFGYVTCGFYKRGPRIIRICPLCHSRFEANTPWDGTKWMLANLGVTLLPSTDILFGKPVKFTLPLTAESST